MNINKNRLIVVGQNFFNVCAATTGNVEAIEKVLKITGRCIEACKITGGAVSEAFENLSDYCKSTVLIFDSIKIFSSVKTLVCKDKDGKYFLTNIENSIQKRIDRVCLAVHTTFKTIKGMKKLGFVTLGEFAKKSVGRLPVFDLLTDTFIVLSSFFSTWDSIVFGLPAVHKKTGIAKEKLKKWKSRPEDIKRLKELDPSTIEAFSLRYLKFKENITKELCRLTELKALKDSNMENLTSEKIKAKRLSEIKKVDGDIAKLKLKVVKVIRRIELIEANKILELAAELEKQKIHGYGGKIHKWTIIKKNYGISETKTWLKVVNAVGKIGVVVSALTLTGVYGSVWALPVALTMIVLGNILDTLGLTKILYEEFAKEKPIPKV